ncbi:MAG: tight adherence protein [Solirubrobacteraceae bacterium]|nr:tight adherence protein [Solirubrobacteraceae bacterium]
MSAAVLLAGLAGAVGVFAAWDLIAAVEGAVVVREAGRLVAPLRRAAGEGREPTRPERRRLGLLAAAALLGAGWIVAGPWAGMALAAGGPWAAVAVVRARRRRWREALAADAPVAARALADALAGGHSLRGALAAVARDGGVPDPAGAQLRAVARALALGEPTEATLERLRARAGAGPWETIVAALLLQREAGGDLAALLRGTAEALEDASRLERDARTATAQARFTGLLVCALPLGTAVLAELARPGYLASLLASPLTAWLAGCALVFQLAALLLISRMSRVRD